MLLPEADTATWTDKVENANQLTAVFFYAPWCRACKAALPKLQRIEKKYAGEVSFFQVNFKAETELCYRQRVFNFPTVHFYLPGIGRVAAAELTAANTLDRMTAELDRLLQGRELYEKISAAGASAAIEPLVQYTELVGVLQGVAEMVDSRNKMDSMLAERRKEAESRIRRTATEYGLSVAITRDPTYEPPGYDSLVSQKETAAKLGSLLGAKSEAARLRAMVEGDTEYIGELTDFFSYLDKDQDGLVRLGTAGRSIAGLETALASLQPPGGKAGTGSELVERLAFDKDAAEELQAAEQGEQATSAMSINQSTFVSLMIDKTVKDFAAGGKALLPAFQALDADSDGAITQPQLVGAIDHFCEARPGADGCAINDRSLRLALAFRAFANDDQTLDYEGFVEMVSCRNGGFGTAQPTTPLSPALTALAVPSAVPSAAAGLREQTVVQKKPNAAAAPPPPPAEPASLRLPMRCMHEAVGTAFIVTGGSAGVASLLGPTWTAAVWAAAVAVGIGTFSGSSGAHFNPAITTALVFNGEFEWREAPFYLLAQLAGAYGAETAVAKLSAATILLPGAAAPVAVEVALTAALALGAFSLGDLARREVLKPWMPPLGVGCIIFSINVFFGNLGAGINPAMAAAPRLVAATFGGWGSAALAGVRSYVFGALVGGVLGAKLFRRMVAKDTAYDKVCSWICAEGPR